VIRAGDAINVVPGAGTLVCDVRADHLDAVESVMDAVPAVVGGATLRARNLRRWPGMDAAEAAAPVLERASALLGTPVLASSRGGASDASHFAGVIPLTIDGLGPLGGDAHAPGEWLHAPSLFSRAKVALALVQASLIRP
jgi:glutamate carboxypeptidase